MSSTNSNKGLKVGLGIILALFLGTAFYASMLYNENKETEVTLTGEKNQVMADLKDMVKQYDAAIGENEIANKDLVAARDRIISLMDSLKTAKNSISSLWTYKKKFLAVEKEMDVLLNENDRLKLENKFLVTSLDSTQIRLTETAAFTDSLLVQNTELADVMKGASVLQTVGLKGFGVIERSSGKLIPTERARRSDMVRICFTVAKNALVETGEKELYVQIIDPQNNVLGTNSQVEFDDQVLNYSLISRFNYENRNLDICEFITPVGDKDFEQGRYIINIFNENALISSSKFILR
jgi:regulator of replication initiation timing